MVLDWLQRLFDYAPVLLCAMNQDGEFVAANPAWEILLGWSPDEVVGRHFDFVTHPDDLARAAAAVEASFATGATNQIEVRNLHKDGSYRWLSWTAPPPGPDGFGVAIAVDVTQLRERNQKLEQVRQRLASVLETAPFYVTLTSPDGVIEYINRTYAGLTPEQVASTQLLDWLPREHRPIMLAAFERVLAGEHPVEIEVQGQAQDGGATWYRSRLGAITVGDEITGITIIGEDISEEIRLAERERRSASLEAVGRVAGAIAHDFNNMLMAMRGSIELIELDLPEGEHPIKPELGHLRAAVEHSRAMVNQLLDAVRQRPEARDTIDLVTATRGLLPLLERAAGDHIELELELHAEAGELPVPLAEHELQQVLMNLVSNSREAMAEPGKVSICVDEQQVDGNNRYWLPQGRYARLRVEDTGPGVPAAIQARAFEPFYTTKRKGSGFGLATCHALARSRGGDIWIDSPATGGARVTLCLPLAEARERARSFEPPVAPTPSDTLTGPSLTILYVEDDELSRSATTRYLGRLGHELLIARDGEEALALAQQHLGTIDVLVSDVAMPRRDGISLIEELHRLRPTLPAIVTTGYSDTDKRQRLAELGVPVLDKPISPVDLLAAIQGLVAPD